MDTFHDEVSPLVDASQSRLVSGKDGEEWITYAYAFRLGCSTLDERHSWLSPWRWPELVS